MVCPQCLRRIENKVRSSCLTGVQNVAKVVRRGRLRWFGHVECKSGDDWVSACRSEA